MLNFNRIEQLTKENHKSLSFLSASVLGKYRTFLRDVRDHNGKITGEQIAKLASALDTTPEYLEGKTDIKEKAAPISGSDLSEKEVEFLRKVDLLNPAMQRLSLACSVLDEEEIEHLANVAEMLAKAKGRL